MAQQLPDATVRGVLLAGGDLGDVWPTGPEGLAEELARLEQMTPQELVTEADHAQREAETCSALRMARVATAAPERWTREAWSTFHLWRAELAEDPALRQLVISRLTSDTREKLDQLLDSESHPLRLDVRVLSDAWLCCACGTRFDPDVAEALVLEPLGWPDAFGVAIDEITLCAGCVSISAALLQRDGTDDEQPR